MSITSFLNKTCTISRKVETQSASGYTDVEWDAMYEDVRVCIQTNGSSYETRGMRSERGAASYTAFFEGGTDVRVGDLVAWGSVVASVVSLDDDDAGHLDYTAVTLLRVSDGLVG